MHKINFRSNNEPELPNNFYAEQAILNIILTKSSFIPKVLSSLKIDSFYFEEHRLIYQNIFELIEKNRQVNVTNIIRKLESNDSLKKIGGIERIISILNRFESFLDLDEYIRLINENYSRRLIIYNGKQMILWGNNKTLEIEEILENIEKSVTDLNQERYLPNLYSASEIMDDVYEEMRLKGQKNKIRGLLTSFTNLDAIVQGFQKSDLVVIAGRPSMGKTAFSLNVGKNIVENYEIPLLIFSLEMDRQQIMYRLIADKSGIDSTRLKSGKMSSSDWKLLSTTMTEIAQLPIFIDDNPNLNIMDIQSRMRTIFNDKKKKGIVILDYLQLMKVNSKFDNRVLEISYLTRNLKILAKQFEIPILVLSQLSRGVESRTNKRPMLSDLRDSGSIEQDADIVIMLYREEYYNDKKTNEQLTELIVAKHRNGPIGTATLIFNPVLTNFRDI